MPGLRLQDLTIDSIRAYAYDQLLDPIQRRFTKDKNSLDKAEDLLNRIVHLADGVFLWVVIVIRDFRDGLQDFADLDELVRAIEELPPGIDSLYIRMLDRIKPANRRDAARFLQIILYHERHFRLSLYRFYFIDRQKRVVEDLPFDCEKISQHDLVQACHELQTRLISHTVGLLNVIPGEWTDIPDFEDVGDPIILARINVHHRTVLEFLSRNTAAKAFLADAGMLEQHIRLSIARGFVAQLVHNSRRDGELLKYFDITRAGFVLYDVMYQVSAVERLLGAAQGKFLRSLHGHSFVPHHRISADTELNWGDLVNEPWCTGSKWFHTDLIGLAAKCGMGRYVCQVLDRAFVEPKPVAFSGSKLAHTPAKDEVDVTWLSSIDHSLDPFHYRQQLDECFAWTLGGDQSPTDRDARAETYLLACWGPPYPHSDHPDHFTFIRVLLHAGANPMVRFSLGDKTELLRFDSPCSISCFWGMWVRFLIDRVFDAGSSNSRYTVDDLWKTTKALIAQGANINFQIEVSLFRFLGGRSPLDIKFTYSAMFGLEGCFHRLPEFQEFAVSVEPMVVRPLRKIGFLFDWGHIDSFNEYDRVCPSNEESQMLWPLVEKLEKTHLPDDLEELHSAMIRVWKTYRPDDKLDSDFDE